MWVPGLDLWIVWTCITFEAIALAIVVAGALTARRDPDEASGRHLDWPDLGLQGRVGGSNPVLAEGTIGKYRFSFFAQNDSWTFDVFERLDSRGGVCLFRRR